MKKYIQSLFFLLLFFSFTGFSQTTLYSASLPHTNGTPVSAPSTSGSWLRFDKTNQKVFKWSGSAWGLLLAVPNADYGDITASSDGTVWNIDAGVVAGNELASSGVVSGTYGNSTNSAQVTIDDDGRITSASNVSISGVSPGGAAGGDLSGTYPNPDIAAGAVGPAEIAVGGVDLSTSDVTGNLPVARLNSGTSASASTFWCGDGTWATPAGGAVAGAFIGTRVLTSGTTYTPTAGTNTITVVIIGGGGGGGGVKGAAASSGAAGGGGSGGICIKTLTGISGTYAYVIGAGGAGGVGATPTNGTNGAESSFTAGATTYTASFGFGGTACTSGATTQLKVGGSGATISTNGDLNGAGSPGGVGLTLSTNNQVASGAGASSFFGGGGNARVSTGVAGFAAIGYGSGGGGAVSQINANYNGGNGSPGVIIVYEYQ